MTKTLLCEDLTLAHQPLQPCRSLVPMVNLQQSGHLASNGMNPDRYWLSVHDTTAEREE